LVTLLDWSVQLTYQLLLPWLREALAMIAVLMVLLETELTVPKAVPFTNNVQLAVEAPVKLKVNAGVTLLFHVLVVGLTRLTTGRIILDGSVTAELAWSAIVFSPNNLPFTVTPGVLAISVICVVPGPVMRVPSK
jgi:hypothetical protein